MRLEQARTKKKKKEEEEERKKEKGRKYCTNKGTTQKHTNPNK